MDDKSVLEIIKAEFPCCSDLMLTFAPWTKRIWTILIWPAWAASISGVHLIYPVIDEGHNNLLMAWRQPRDHQHQTPWAVSGSVLLSACPSPRLQYQTSFKLGNFLEEKKRCHNCQTHKKIKSIKIVRCWTFVNTNQQLHAQNVLRVLDKEGQGRAWQ